MTNERQLVNEAYTSTLQPPAVEPITVWARREVVMDSTSPIGGHYKIENSPYAEEWFVAWQTPTVRMVTTVGPNQGGRTKAMEVACLHSIANRPGPMQWNTVHNDKAKEFAAQRWWPMARACAPVAVKLPRDPRLETPRGVSLTDMPFTMQGANETNLQEKSIMTQFNDECFQWANGFLKKAWKRCDVSYAWCYKVWNGSTGADEGSEFAESYEDGDCREWHFRCLSPKCKWGQVYKWGKRNELGGLKWVTNEKTKPGGVWDFDEVKKTVYYECEKCGHKHSDSIATRRAMNGTGYYKPSKGLVAEPIIKNGRTFYPFTREKVSFRFNILAVNWPGIYWGQWVEEFLKATLKGKKFGDYEDLKNFWTRRMAEFWNEGKFINATSRIVVSDYRIFNPDGTPAFKQSLWQGEHMRFMAIDKQELGYYAVIRAVKKTGESRLIWRGEPNSYDEADDIREQFQVRPRCTLIDAGYESREVYAAAIKRNWLCTKGEDRDSYLHILRNEKTKQNIKVLRPYSEQKQGDPGFKFGDAAAAARKIGLPGVIRRGARMLPQYAPLYMFSNLSVKNILSAFKQGRATIYWGIPEDVGEDYLKQINSEVRYKTTDRHGKVTQWWSNTGPDGKQRAKPNHYWDCEVILMLAMIMGRLIDLEQFQNDKQTTEAGIIDVVSTPFDEQEAAA